MRSVLDSFPASMRSVLDSFPASMRSVLDSFPASMRSVLDSFPASMRSVLDSFPASMRSVLDSFPASRRSVIESFPAPEAFQSMWSTTELFVPLPLGRSSGSRCRRSQARHRAAECAGSPRCGCFRCARVSRLFRLSRRRHHRVSASGGFFGAGGREKTKFPAVPPQRSSRPTPLDDAGLLSCPQRRRKEGGVIPAWNHLQPFSISLSSDPWSRQTDTPP
jgi:hypothetical protein